MRKLLAVSLLPLLILACASPRGSLPLPVPADLLQEDPFDARYKVHCDDVSGRTVCVMTGNALRPFSPRYPLLTLGVVSEVDRLGAPRYFLRTVYVGEGQWLNIGRGSRLRIAIDGETVKLGGAGSKGSRYTGEDKKFYEVARFDASAAIIRKIALASTVAVSLQGDFLLEKNFGSVNTLYFRQFVQHYIDRTPTADK